MEKLLKLNENEKVNVVRDWYLSIPEIIQSEENGSDLEEILESELEQQEDIIDKMKLSTLEVLIVVALWYGNQTTLFYTEHIIESESESDSDDDIYLDDFLTEKIHDILFKFTHEKISEQFNKNK
jgi:hypothetical protein